MILIENDKVTCNGVTVKTFGHVLPYDPIIGINMSVEGVYKIYINGQLIYEMDGEFISFNIEDIFGKKEYFLEIAIKSPDIDYYYDIVLIDNTTTTLGTVPYFYPELFPYNAQIPFKFNTNDQSYENIYAFSWKDIIKELGKKIKFKNISYSLPNVKQALSRYTAFVVSKNPLYNVFNDLNQTNIQKLPNISDDILIPKKHNDSDQPEDQYDLMMPMCLYDHDLNDLYTSTFSKMSYDDLYEYFTLKTNSFPGLNAEQQYIANYARFIEGIRQNKLTQEQIVSTLKSISGLSLPSFSSPKIQRWVIYGLFYVFDFYKSVMSKNDLLDILTKIKLKYIDFHEDNQDPVHGIRVFYPLLLEENKYNSLSDTDKNLAKNIYSSITSSQYAIMYMEFSYSYDLYYTVAIKGIIG